MKSEINKQLGKRIQYLRKQKGLSQENLAEALNIATTSLSYIETGRGFMSLNTLENLAKDYNADGVDKIIKRIYTISKQLEANCNPTYLLDNLLLYILEVKYLCKK